MIITFCPMFSGKSCLCQQLKSKVGIVKNEIWTQSDGNYLEKQKQKYTDDLAGGKKKHIPKMNERDKRQLRKL